MVVSISAVILLGAVLIYTIGKARHKMWHASAAVLFGDYLGRTSAGAWIDHLVTSVIQMLNHLH